MENHNVDSKSWEIQYWEYGRYVACDILLMYLVENKGLDFYSYIIGMCSPYNQQYVSIGSGYGFATVLR